MYSVAEIWNGVQTRLFPLLEAYCEEALTDKQKRLVAILEIVRIEEVVPKQPGRWRGRPSHSRRVLARAFLVKAVYDIPTTEALVEMLRTQSSLRRICGYDTARSVPSAATFSRAFREFADLGLCDTAHQGLAGLPLLTGEDIMTLSLGPQSIHVSTAGLAHAGQPCLSGRGNSAFSCCASGI